jgi:hypothetical protein
LFSHQANGFIVVLPLRVVLGVKGDVEVGERRGVVSEGIIIGTSLVGIVVAVDLCTITIFLEGVGLSSSELWRRFVDGTEGGGIKTDSGVVGVVTFV